MKQKTHSGMKKRIKITKTGKMIFQKPCKRHLLTNKSKRQKKIKTVTLHSSDKARINNLRAKK